MFFPLSRCMKILNLTRISSFKYCCRNYKWINTKSENAFKKVDKIPEKDELIYLLSINKPITIMHYLSTASACILGGTFTTLFVYPDYIKIFSEFGNMPIFSNDLQIYFAPFITVMMFVSVHSLLKRLPLRIYWDEKNQEYCSIMLGLLPWKNEKLFYKPNSIKFSKALPILPWYENQYAYENKKLIFLPYNFKNPKDFNNMIDYS